MLVTAPALIISTIEYIENACSVLLPPLYKNAGSAVYKRAQQCNKVMTGCKFVQFIMNISI